MNKYSFLQVFYFSTYQNKLHQIIFTSAKLIQIFVTPNYLTNNNKKLRKVYVAYFPTG
nr:MAG TPA: hypothetical protein [Caudoviricetes sp.]